MSIQKITCQTIGQFMAVISELAQRGIGFDANADTLTITLNGAY